MAAVSAMSPLRNCDCTEKLDKYFKMLYALIFRKFEDADNDIQGDPPGFWDIYDMLLESCIGDKKELKEHERIYNGIVAVIMNISKELEKEAAV